jgi:probable rRNA maturation factor
MKSAKAETMGLTIDVQIASPLWDKEPKAEEALQAGIRAAAKRVLADGEVSVLLTDDAAIQSLNREWRSIDKATNVLSFPANTPKIVGAQVPLGDIVIAYETLAHEAAHERKPVLEHLAHLVVHGYLHLLGYDHETDSDAELMEAMEREILASIGIADPYKARGASAA